MAEPFVGEVRITAFGLVPRNWLPCNGQALPIAQYAALYAVLGTTYGGDGVSNFMLPNLQGRAPVSMSPTLPIGSAGGQATHVLTAAELPAHSHAMLAVSDGANTTQPAAAMPATKQRGGADIYAPGGSPAVALEAQALAMAGQGQGHDNMQPYQTLNFIIATVGVFPPRN